MTEEHFSVHDQDGYARVYDEDDTLTIRRGDLRALLDLATGSMDFGSGFWDNEQAEIARATARVLGINPDDVTPSNLLCTYTGTHRFGEWIAPSGKRLCVLCHGATRLDGDD